MSHEIKGETNVSKGAPWRSANCYPLDTRGCTCAREGISASVDDGVAIDPWAFFSRTTKSPENPTSARAKDNIEGVKEKREQRDLRKSQPGLMVSIETGSRS